jgi:hypothetical protein
MTRQKMLIGSALVAGIAALGVGQAALEGRIQEQTTAMAPRFEVDPLWPKPLPNGWVLGTVIGVGVDSRDHVYIVHRGNITANVENNAELGRSLCCTAGPPIMEFDPAGNLVRAWGGPVEGGRSAPIYEFGPNNALLRETTQPVQGEPYVWPNSNHGIAIDNADNVYIGGNGGGDSHVLKFTRDGRYISTIGVPGRPINSNSPDSYGQVAKITIDEGAREAYFADGYANKRVAVVDMQTGNLKRFWGAYGNVPQDGALPRNTDTAPPPPQFRNPVHCADPTNDGFVYVCDRQTNRIQVFRKDGTYVKEAFYFPRTGGDGSVWDVAFSRDAMQRYMYIADGKNMRVMVVDRPSLELLTTFGTGGRQPGAFMAVHSIATDSRGNIFTTETYEGRRVQKFVYRGLAPVTRMHQGVPWPTQ